MTCTALEGPHGSRLVATELRKLLAFARRDFRVALSYRMSFVSDLVGIVGQVVIFYFVGRLIDPTKLPRYGGTHVTYLQFAAIGIGVAVFVEFGLQHVSRAVRSEQLMGTLDSLLMTPTAWVTIQVGSVAFELLFLLLRLTLFVVGIALVFGLDFHASGALPAAVLMVAFFPFVWGLGVIAAAVVLTFRRGGGIVGLGSLALALLSGLYFPTNLLPGWLADAAAWNPLALTTNGIREALISGAHWSSVASKLAVLAPASVGSLVLGALCFRVAMRRERRLGTLGLY